MKVNVTDANPALVSLFENPSQMITLDANLFIPPYRKLFSNKKFTFDLFKDIWLDPIFIAFPKIAIHEAVYDELVMPCLNNFVVTLLSDNKITIHKDSDLSDTEKLLRDSIENRIYPYTNYDPKLNNKSDRGEVKSLSYIAVKGLLYFSAHDNAALQLIEKANQWSTGLENIMAIHMYELIYYLHSKSLSDRQYLRILYKYQYFLTLHEKKTNPEWGEFIKMMDALYRHC